MKSNARTVATSMETAFTDAHLYPASIAIPLDNELTVCADSVKLSPNNVAYVHPAIDHFCVAITNPSVTGGAVVYQCDNGGLQPGLTALAGACPDATYGADVVS